MMVEYFWAFLTGLAGSLHCLGMCGPLVIAYSLHLKPEGPRGSPPIGSAGLTAGLAHHAIFHGGRIAAYGLMGGLAGGLVYFGTLGKTLQSIRIPITIAGGLFMLYFGLMMLKRMPIPLPSISSVSDGKGAFLSRFIGSRLSSGRLPVKWLLGFAAGFLPCMLSWAMVVKAALTANISEGLLIMVLFGLGTVPALLFTGYFASLFSLKVRLAGERVAGLSVIGMGLILLWKGVSKLV